MTDRTIERVTEHTTARRARTLFAVWAVTVSMLSLLPQQALPPTFGVSDLIQHGGVYAAGGLCAAAGWRDRRGLILALAGAVALGALLEILQETLIPGRVGELKDALANTAGLVLGAALLRLLNRRRPAARD